MGVELNIALPGEYSFSPSTDKDLVSGRRLSGDVYVTPSSDRLHVRVQIEVGWDVAIRRAGRLEQPARRWENVGSVDLTTRPDASGEQVLLGKIAWGIGSAEIIGSAAQVLALDLLVEAMQRDEGVRGEIRKISPQFVDLALRASNV